MAKLDDSFFRQLCRDAGVALIATDRELRIRFWNAAAGRIFGGLAEAMMDQSLLSIVPAAQRDAARRLFEKTLEKAEISEFDFSHRSPAGELMSLAVTLSPVVDDQGQTLGLAVHVRNVTRRLRLERDTARSQKMSALGAMAGGIAQNFNNVIGGVITSIDFAQTSDDPMFVRRLLSSAVTALMRASHLTQSLLVFAEGDRSDTVNADLVQTVEGFLKPLAGQLTRQGIQLEMSLQPFQASVPLKRIQTILDRLIANAMEAMPEGGTLRVEVGCQNQEAFLLVSDTGAGISSDNLARLFEPFFTTKTPESHTSAAPHVGLGLAVVHGVVRDLGGTISITSEPDRGTSCMVRLPVRGGPATASDKSGPAGS